MLVQSPRKVNRKTFYYWLTPKNDVDVIINTLLIIDNSEYFECNID